MMKLSGLDHAARQRFPLRLRFFTVTLVATCVISAAASWNIYNSYRASKTAEERHLRARELEGASARLGEQYEEKKSIYSEGASRLKIASGQLIERDQGSQQWRVLSSLALVLFSLLALSLSWLEVLRRAKRHLAGKEASEQALKKARRSLETLSSCNKALVHARDESELLNEVCNAIVEKGGYRLAWVDFAEETEERKVRPVAQAGSENGYPVREEIRRGDSDSGRGPLRTAVTDGRPSLIEHIPTHPGSESWRDEAVRVGYASSIALPLLNGDKTKTYGTLNIHASEPRGFDLEEIGLLREMSSDLAFGITAIRTRAERERAETELREALQTLQGAYESLERAKTAASASEKLAAVGRLTAGVSHEILNPLNGIVINLHYMLRIQEAPEWIREELSEMLEQTQRITKIAQGLLYFTRKRPPEHRQIDLNETVRRTLELIEHDLRLSNIEVDLKLSEDLPLISADQDQLQQVVLNLLSNARDAMPAGGRLELKTTEVPPLLVGEGRLVELTIKDTGAGIDPKHMDKLFDPFFTTKPEGEGTGLGLSICQGIIETHGGLIWAENSPEGGTVFTVRLSAEEEREWAVTEY